jgi:DNA-binding GntR family transcriptional regulator
MRFTRLSTQTLRQQVYDQLREKIISAGVLPGETLSLRGLSEEFGVSLMPIREALWQLESERVVVIEANRRIRVNTLTEEEMRDLYQVRLFLETTAAKRSCARRPDSALPAAKALLEQTTRYLKRSPRRYIEANFAFHRTIYRHCGSEIFLRLIDLLWARIGPYFYYAQLREDVDLSASQCHHEAMYEAWISRDTARMVKAIRNDLASPIHPPPASTVEGRKAGPASRGSSSGAARVPSVPRRTGRTR